MSIPSAAYREIVRRGNAAIAEETAAARVAEVANRAATIPMIARHGMASRSNELGTMHQVHG